MKEQFNFFRKKNIFNYFVVLGTSLLIVMIVVIGNAAAFNQGVSAVTQAPAQTAGILGNLGESLGKLFGTTSSRPDSANYADYQVLNTDQGNVVVVSEESQVIKIVKDNSAAVVSVIASAQVPKYEQCYRNSPVPNSDLFGDFGQFFNLSIPGICQNGTVLQQVGAGSGYLVSPDGYILTNKHVVSDENGEYTVILNDQKHLGQKVPAKVVARDPANDIAVLKIDIAGLPFVTLGDSDNLQVGQTVVAIGYALGQFNNTVSKGVISGLQRSIVAGDVASQSSENLQGVIQTDAAINPGNSGGPLIDLQGNVIGMNVAIVQGSQNIGFALPISEIKTVYNSVRTTGTIQRAYLGVRYVPINSEIKRQNGLNYDYGVLIVSGQSNADLAVVPGSPADQAGLVENDIILQADGKRLDENSSLGQVIADHRPGDKVALRISHKGTEKEVTVTLGSR